MPPETHNRKKETPALLAPFQQETPNQHHRATNYQARLPIPRSGATVTAAIDEIRHFNLCSKNLNGNKYDRRWQKMTLSSVFTTVPVL